MSVIFNTLNLASSDLISLSIISFIILTMLATMGNVVLGETHLGMSTVSGALERILLLWITGDLGGINIVVKGHGLDNIPLMKVAGHLFWVVTWLLLFCVLLNFVIGILAIWYCRARNNQNGEFHDVLADMRAMIGPLKRRQRLAFDRMLEQVSPGGSRKTGNRAVDGPGEEKLIMKLRGIWLQKQLFHLGAVENMLACASSNKGKSSMSLDIRMKAAAIAEYVSENLSHDVDIKGTKMQLRVVRISCQVRSLANAIERVKGITRAVEQSFRNLQTAANEQKAMSHRLQQIADHQLEHFWNPRQVSPSRLRYIDTGDCLPGQPLDDVHTRYIDAQDCAVESISRQQSSFRSATASWNTSVNTSGGGNRLKLGGYDFSFAWSSEPVKPHKESKSTPWAGGVENNGIASGWTPTVIIDDGKTGLADQTQEPRRRTIRRRRSRNLSGAPLVTQVTQFGGRPSTCPDSREAKLKGLGELQVPGSIQEDLVFIPPTRERKDTAFLNSPSNGPMRSRDNNGGRRSNCEDLAEEDINHISSDDEDSSMFSPIAPADDNT